jgi:hypothetical protein
VALKKHGEKALSFREMNYKPKGKPRGTLDTKPWHSGVTSWTSKPHTYGKEVCNCNGKEKLSRFLKRRRRMKRKRWRRRSGKSWERRRSGTWKAGDGEARGGGERAEGDCGRLQIENNQETGTQGKEAVFPGIDARSHHHQKTKAPSCRLS